MSKGKVLIADDTETYRTILGDGLAAQGYDIIYAADGLETVKTVKEELKNLKLVVLDLLMPKMLGFDALKDIREMEGGKSLQVIVITSLFKNLDDIKRVKALGAVGFIDKSLPVEEVLFRIKSVLEPQEAEKKEEVQVPESVSVIYREGDESFSAYTFTVGSKGLYLRTTDPLTVGAQISVDFELGEGGRRIVSDARVTKVVTSEDREDLFKYPKGMEIEFTGMNPADRSHLADWVQKLAAEKSLKN